MTTKTDNNLNTAQTILSQLGGNRFAAMTGAKNFVAIDDGLTFKIGRNAKSVSHVTITLNGLDLYDVKFIRCRGTKITTVAEFDNVYADTLRIVFESATGLYTSL